MSQVNCTVAFYTYISSAWVELDTSHPYHVSWGMSDNNPTSRLADVGEFTLALNNSTGQYTVGGPSALAGWKKDLPFKAEFTFEGTIQKIWRGYISDIQIRPNTKDKKAYITVVEWLDYASRHPIVNPGVQTDQRGDEVLTTIVAEVDVQPQATDFDTGVETFPTAFDTVTSKTKAYTEFAKVALSEIGYVYEVHDKTYGETIKFESASARHGWIAPGNIPLAVEDSFFVLNEDGDFLLNEDGGFALNDDVAAFTADGSVISDFDAPYGEHMINRMTAYANPRRLGGSRSPSKNIELTMAADTEFVSDLPTTNFASQPEMVVGEWDVGDPSTHRTWIKPSFAALPEGALFEAAILTLVPIEDGTSNVRTMRAHRCLRDVVAAEATWNVYSTGNNWGTAGCSNSSSDYDGAIEIGNMSVPAAYTLGVPIQMTFSAEGVAELQKMYDGTYTNNGIVLFMDTQSADATNYASTEHGTPSYRPIITLTYSDEILFELDEEIVIGSGQTVTIKGTYADPNGGARISAQDMITPVVSDDYTMFTATNGGGTDISADLTLTSIVFGTEGFTHQVTNDNASVGYLNKYNLRGTGIYLYNPIEHAANNSASINEYGTESEIINQKYKTDLYSGSVFVESVVDEFRQPRTVLNSITFNANKSGACMMAFLYTEIGDMRYISITEAGIAGNYYIQGIELDMNGGIIMVKWIVVLALSLQVGLSPLAVEFAGGSTDGVSYGYLPRTSNLTTRSWGAWIYLDDDPALREYLFGALSATAADLGAGEYGSGYRISIYTGRKIEFFQAHTGASSADGTWRTPLNSVPLTTWTHILITHDISTPTTAPIIYINGSSQALTEVSAPVGTVSSEDGNALILGNNKSTVYSYDSAFDGKVFDPRIYNDIKTSGNATTLYNAGTPDETLVTDGLVFQGFNVRTGDLADYVDTTLTSAMTLRENIYGSIGVVNGAPVGRAEP